MSPDDPPLRRTPTFRDRLAASARVGTPGRLSPPFRRALDGWVGRFVRRWFDPTIEGLEHLPEDGPFLLVANHSGAGIYELFALAQLWTERFGERRPLAGMAHALVFHVPLAGAMLRGGGAIPSGYQPVLDTLASGVPVLVFPGGDHESFRPLWQGDRVDFAGRKGFLRLARAAGVPVIPMGIRGSHRTIPILWRSRALPWLLVLPRALGVKRLPVTLIGLAAGLGAALLTTPLVGPVPAALLGFAVLFSPLPLLCPFPSRIHLRLGEPIAPDDLFVADDPDLARAYERVESAVRALVRG